MFHSVFRYTYVYVIYDQGDEYLSNAGRQMIGGRGEEGRKGGKTERRKSETQIEAAACCDGGSFSSNGSGRTRQTFLLGKSLRMCSARRTVRREECNRHAIEMDKEGKSKLPYFSTSLILIPSS